MKDQIEGKNDNKVKNIIERKDITEETYRQW